jgi:hypothetical protein
LTLGEVRVYRCRKMRRLLLVSFLAAGCGGGGGNQSPDAGPPLFEEKPECQGDPIEALAGDHQLVVSHLEIGELNDGFDLDGDGMPDNKLAAIGALAGPAISDAFERFDIVLPIELFDMPAIAADPCVKLSFYLGAYRLDTDGDNHETARTSGDCNDRLDTINRDVAEDIDNGVDDDCDGYADETMDGDTLILSQNEDDTDRDGVTIKDGDCDETTEFAALIKGPLYPEICGDGLDNDCNGNADQGRNSDGVADCSPYDSTPDVIPLEELSFNTDGTPKIAFRAGGTTLEDGKVMLSAGPSLFSASIPVSDQISLDLRITGTTVVGEVVQEGESVVIHNGRIGGVLDVKTLDSVRGLDVSQIGLEPEDSLLDAMFANVLGTVVGLKKNSMGCRMPDIDVDRDGLEAFCDTMPADDKFIVDMCIDGDGTIVLDQMNVDGTVTHCSQALGDDGKFLFADGISVALKYEAVKAILQEQN